jgi:hypothetical protein
MGGGCMGEGRPAAAEARPCMETSEARSAPAIKFGPLSSGGGVSLLRAAVGGRSLVWRVCETKVMCTRPGAGRHAHVDRV